MFPSSREVGEEDQNLTDDNPLGHTGKSWRYQILESRVSGNKFQQGPLTIVDLSNIAMYKIKSAH